MTISSVNDRQARNLATDRALHNALRSAGTAFKWCLPLTLILLLYMHAESHGAHTVGDVIRQINFMPVRLFASYLTGALALAVLIAILCFSFSLGKGLSGSYFRERFQAFRFRRGNPGSEISGGVKIGD